MKTILWDFDGVILDSMKVRDKGFREIFRSFEKDQIDQLIDYHRANGGLSRYVKIRFFFENILGQTKLQEEEVLKYASRFSNIMRSELTNPAYIIQDSFEFIKNNYNSYNFHIVSGSDQEELRFLCEELEITDYFLSIEGSPVTKRQLVQRLLQKYKYNIPETCLIGDSLNDYDAAVENNISFLGYNNPDLRGYGSYIETFKDLIL